MQFIYHIEVLAISPQPIDFLKRHARPVGSGSLTTLKSALSHDADIQAAGCSP